MGLIVDLPNSYFTFDPGTEGEPTGYAVGNEVSFSMQQFEMMFSFKFVSDSKLGVKPPARTETWRIGVVQNLLYQRSHFAWFNGKVFDKTWTSPVVDSGAKYSFPIYFDDPDSPQEKASGAQVPYRDVYYNSKGFGELLDPWGTPPNDVVSKSSWYVTAADKPQFGCPLRTQGGSQLKAAYQILTFGIWLVAFDPTRRSPVVLAHVPPFTMVYAAEFVDGGDSLLAFGDSRYWFYAIAGSATTVNQALVNGKPAKVQMAAGKGARSPVLVGQTANVRERSWAMSTILAV